MYVSVVSEKRDIESFLFKAKLAITAYHGITDEKELIDELARLERNGQMTKTAIVDEPKPGEAVRKNTGMDTMFRPWKANDAYSVVVRHGAWVGVMVKVCVCMYESVSIYQ